MYNLIDCGREWQLHTIEGAFSGSFKEVVKMCVTVFSIPIEEIELAVSVMCENNHNSANFGMNRTFIFSFEGEVK